MSRNVVHLFAKGAFQLAGVFRGSEYPTCWRVQKATQLPREGDMKVVKVESLVGYQSAAAFNRTLKKTIGVAPGEYRRSLL